MAPKTEEGPQVDDEMVARFAWVLENRGLSRSKWSRAAGMAQANVGQMMRGERKKIPTETFGRLARAANVDPKWLETGEGTPQGSVDPYPSRAEAIELLVAEGCPDGVIKSLRRHSLKMSGSGADRDPGRTYWIDLAEELIQDHRRVRDLLGKVDERMD